MEYSENWQLKFDAFRACVLVPTYNNGATIGHLLQTIESLTGNIIVVNDGSTDNTHDILQSFSSVHIISLPVNKGKGYALRQGFAKALELGYDYAISIDSDGQHFAKDLPAFISKLEEIPGSLIIGARNMNQSSVPAKSSFGNRFSNFWFWAETGIRLPDTQSGYRLYPVERMNGMHFITRKFEFEIEVIVRAAWKGIPVKSVPVTVYYPPPGERISHFRPLRDFTRISILNTFLVLISFLYIRPRDFFRYMFKKNNWKEVLRQQLFHTEQSDGLKAFSTGFGVFMGIIPIWGFQLIVAIFLALVFKLNKALVILFANISIPPIIPLIVFLSYKTGAFWMNGRSVTLTLSRSLTLSSIRYNFKQYLYGSITLAVLAGIGFGIIMFFSLKIFKRNPAEVV